MNLRHFSMALLVSALPLAASADITLDKGDFVAAERVTRNGQVRVSFKLSKSGKAKLRKANEKNQGEVVHTEIDGVKSDLTLKEPIVGDGVEMGPYSADDAQKIIKAIR